MAINSYSSYKEKVEAPFQVLNRTKSTFATVTGKPNSFWIVAPDAGVVPSTAVVPNSLTTGAIGQRNSLTTQRIAQVTCSLGSSGSLMIADRLSHQGGLSGIVATAQTTNLPTAPLTRYASGEGVFVALEIYNAIGSTGTTVTASYTNSQGVAGRTTEVMLFGGTNFREVGVMLTMPLQQGDTGVRSVQSVSVLATTGTAGNFGVTLFKPLVRLPVLGLGSHTFHFDSIIALSGNIPQIENNACLQWIVIPSAASSGTLLASLNIIED
jgi:hypothetical protein